MMSSEQEKTAERIKKKGYELDLLKKGYNKLKDFKEKESEKIKREQARVEIRYWMDRYILPFLTSVAEEGFNEPLWNGVRRLIKEGKQPFRAKNGWDQIGKSKTAFTMFLNKPTVRALTVLVRPYLNYKVVWLQTELDWIIEEIFKSDYPELYDIVTTVEGGKVWLEKLIRDLTLAMRTMI